MISENASCQLINLTSWSGMKNTILTLKLKYQLYIFPIWIVAKNNSLHMLHCDVYDFALENSIKWTPFFFHDMTKPRTAFPKLVFSLKYYQISRNKNVVCPSNYKHKQTIIINYKPIENFQTELRWIKYPPCMHCWNK